MYNTMPFLLKTSMNVLLQYYDVCELPIMQREGSLYIPVNALLTGGIFILWNFFQMPSTNFHNELSSLQYLPRVNS